MVWHTGDAGCVCDSYDLLKCLEETWCGELKESVLERGRRGGCVFLRPDSGNPKEVVLQVCKDWQIKIREHFFFLSYGLGHCF